MKWSKTLFIMVFCLLIVFPVFAEDTIELTEEEIEFINEHGPITLGIDPAFVPFEFLDKDGTYSGFANDYIELIKKKTGLQMEIVEGLTWSEAYEAAVEKDIDCLPCVSMTAERKQYFLFSEPYYKYQRVILMREGSSISNLEDLNDGSVAVQRNSSHQGFLMNYGQIDLHYYDTAEDAINAVANGVEEAFIGNLAATSYIISTNGITEMKYVIIDTPDANQLYFAVRNDLPILRDIINKGLKSITEEERIEIQNKWIGLRETVDYSGLIRILAVIGTVIGIIIVVSFYWIIRLKKEINKRIVIEENLRIATLEAERANEVKSNFLARMSHEIRTPLNAITGLSYLLLNTDLTKNQKSHLEKIRHAGSIMLSIINDILDFSKIEAGKIELEHESFNLDDVIRNVMNIISFKVDEKKLHFTFVKDPKLSNYYFGDSKRIEQILLNIINNAVKFTEAGDISFSVALIGHKHTMYDVEFRIKDTGIGMSEAHLENIFEPFSQEDATISRRFGGTGLGLSIVKNLTDMMGGHIEIDSTLGVGSEFIITISLEIDEEKNLEEQKSFEYIKGIKTLVLNKDINSLSLMSEYLRSFGIDPEFTSSFEQFKQLVEASDGKRTKSYDLVIVDEDSYDGECQALIKEIQPYKIKTIIIRSLLTGCEDGERIRILSKPILPSVLYNTILDLFQYKMMASQIDYTDSKDTRKQVSGKILIVEDNQTNQLIATSLLEAMGIDCDIAENGQIAVEKVENNTYQLILMDLHMPIMDGYEATKKIRTFSETTIIAMTADAIDGVKEKCHAYGMDYFISKPFDPEQFMDIVHNHLSSSVETEDPLVIDYQIGIKMMGGNEQLFKQVVGVFLEENLNVIEEMNHAVNNKDFKAVKEIAHKIKGSSGSIGAESVRQLASDIQSAAEEEHLENVTLLRNRFILNVEKLIVKLKEDYS